MNIIQKIENDEILNKLKENFTNDIYLVGGAVRDLFLGKLTYDRDILVEGIDAKEFALKCSEIFDAKFIPLDEINKIYRLVFKDKINCIDITNPLDNSLEKDLKRRDLTINSLAVNLNTLNLIDVTGGADDLNNKKINMISKQNFVDDPLRLLRIFRFHAILGFDIDKKLFTVIKKYKNLIHKPAVERVQYEIMKMFSGDYVFETLLLMDDCGMLEEIFPFVKELKLVPPNSHHHLDLFHHSVEAVKQITKIYSDSGDLVKKHMDAVDFGGFSRLAHLKLAGFMHDIGKFSTWTIENDRHRFIKHDDVGAKMSVNILKKLNFSNKQINYISSMIKFHIYPSQVMSGQDVTEKVMMRYIRKMDDNCIDNIILAKSDRLSARGPKITDDVVQNNLSSLNKLLDYYLNVKDSLKPLPKLLDGNDIIKILNIKPSKQLGFILEKLHDAQLNGDVISKDDAIHFVKNLQID